MAIAVPFWIIVFCVFWFSCVRAQYITDVEPVEGQCISRDGEWGHCSYVTDAEINVPTDDCRTSPLGWRECKISGFWNYMGGAPETQECTYTACSVHAHRSCGIKGISMLLFYEDGRGDGNCQYRCSAGDLPHNVIDCGGDGATSSPACCGLCPGGCVDPGTGQPLPWPCCPPPPGDDDVTK